MDSVRDKDNKFYKIVVNHEEQYSIWPILKDIPLGWKEVGKKGSKSECLEYIKKVWTDVRPRSLKEKIEKILKGENCFRVDPMKNVCQLFEAQVEQNPNKTAIFFQDSRLTYLELNEKANQLAHHLLKITHGNLNNVVGLCVERSLDMVIGALGILKAGYIYAPMDPLYPGDRLAFMMQEARVCMLLTQEKLQKKIPEQKSSVIYLDKDWHTIHRQNNENPNGNIFPESISHIIFTSGSTGTPKGVIVTHSSLYHNVHAIGKQLNVKADDVYLHTASIAFTSALRQLLVPLSIGATVVIATPEQRTNPLALFELIKRQNVTIWDTVASFWEICTHALAHNDSKFKNLFIDNKLRLILSSGGELPSQIVRNWFSRSSKNISLVNMYGQTETIGNILVYPILSNEDKLKIVPLGEPITHIQRYLLNDDMKNVSVGIPAEICIGGDAIACGYLNRPELTAEKFIPDPFSDKPGSRLYKTGDRGRYQTNGTIEFLGRIDLQIKIRGFRIEPGEIERVLKEHPAIKEAVVVAKDDISDEKCLAAYYVIDAVTDPNISELRDLVISRLPEYMVPSAFVKLDKLPRLPNNKIDREALPAIEGKRPNLSQPYIAPRSEIHNYLVSIWCDILKINGIGIRDKFFELGGTSLLAARFINRVNERLGISIPIQTLFEAPTIDEYAEFLSKSYSQAVINNFANDTKTNAGLVTNDVDNERVKKHRNSNLPNSRRELAERQRKLRESLKRFQ